MIHGISVFEVVEKEFDKKIYFGVGGGTRKREELRKVKIDELNLKKGSNLEKRN